MNEVFGDWPAVVLLSSSGTLLRDHVSLDRITSREVLAAVWAGVRLLDRRRAMGEIMALQV